MFNTFVMPRNSPNDQDMADLFVQLPVEGVLGQRHNLNKATNKQNAKCDIIGLNEVIELVVVT